MTTPFNERLSEILTQHREWMRGVRTDHIVGTSNEQTKAAILSLFREMVEEAKPERKGLYHGYGWDSDNQRVIGRNQAADEYKANLLQQLGEKE